MGRSVGPQQRQTADWPVRACAGSNLRTHRGTNLLQSLHLTSLASLTSLISRAFCSSSEPCETFLSTLQRPHTLILRCLFIGETLTRHNLPVSAVVAMRVARGRLESSVLGAQWAGRRGPRAFSDACWEQPSYNLQETVMFGVP